MTKQSSFIVSNRELPVLECPVTMLLEHSWGTSRLMTLQAKEISMTCWSLVVWVDAVATNQLQ